MSSGLNRDDTNSRLSNTFRSSMPSPMPINLIGIFNWSTMPMTTPPFDVPSSLVIANEVMSVALENY